MYFETALVPVCKGSACTVGSKKQAEIDRLNKKVWTFFIVHFEVYLFSFPNK